MRRLSLRVRMFGWFSGLAVLLVCGMSAAMYVQTKEALLESLDDELRARASDVAAHLAAGEPGQETSDRRQDRLRGFEAWTLPGPVRIARSATLLDLPDLVAQERLAALDERHPRFAESVSVPAAGDVRVFASAFARPGGPTTVVVTTEDLGEVEDEMDEVLTGFAVTLPAALLLAGAGAWLAARHLTRPLRDIAAAASRVESGGEPGPIPGSGAGDEIDALAATLERTFARLREAYERQSRFSSDAAHELRTPVTVVLSQAEVALRRERTPDEYRETLGHIVGAAQRMQQTLEALLLVARGDAGGLAVGGGRADLAAVARAAIGAAAEEAAAKSVEVRLAAPSAAAVAGDARLLGILVRNLLANAIAYSRDGGPVDVTVAAAGRDVALTVRDEGVGIAPEVLPHVFERFFRADDSRSRASGGSGLGLSLVRLVAEIHGGSAAAASEVGKGTTVTVRLPAARV